MQTILWMGGGKKLMVSLPSCHPGSTLYGEKGRIVTCRWRDDMSSRVTCGLKH